MRAARARGLSDDQAAAVALELERPRARRHELAELAQDAEEQRRAWTWGRAIGRPELLELEPPPPRVAMLCTIERTMYRAAKGRRSPVETYFHDHDRPFQVLASKPTGEELETLRSSRGAHLPSGRAVAFLGRMVEIVGHDARGRPCRVTFARTVLLLGDPRSARMLLGAAPLWILGNGSPCRVTPEGLIL